MDDISQCSAGRCQLALIHAGLSGSALEELVNEYRAVLRPLRHLSRLYPKRNHRALHLSTRVEPERLSDKAAMQSGWMHYKRA